MLYPMNMKLSGRRCVVLGGGAVAFRKVGTLRQAEARVAVIAPEVVPALAEMAERGEIEWQRASYEQGCLRGAFLVICATDDAAVNRQAAEEARREGALVNAPAQPELSDFSVPASLRRGNLLLAISTGDLSPAFSRVLREYLEEEFPPVFGEWLERLHVLREEAKARIGTSREREAFWRRAMDRHVLDFVRDGQLDRAEAELRYAIDGSWTES